MSSGMSSRDIVISILFIGLLFVSCASCQSGGGASSSDGNGADIGSGSASGGGASDGGYGASGSGSGGGAASDFDGGIGLSGADGIGVTGAGSFEGYSPGPGDEGAAFGDFVANDVALKFDGGSLLLEGREAGTPVPGRGIMGPRHSFWIVAECGGRTQMDLEALSKEPVVFTPECSGNAVLYEHRPGTPEWVAYDLGYLNRGQTARLVFLSGSRGAYVWYVNICDSWSGPLMFDVW